jgi:uncharacterized protein (DUF58 family)
MPDPRQEQSDQSRDRNIPPDLLKQVRRLEIRTRRIVEELFGGEYHSVFRGQGVEFREVREYELGDDVRSIDWNVTARTGSPHIKKYEEERELTIMLLVDLSASESFGTGERRKSAAMAELGALLVMSAVSNQDKVGMILFTDQVELYLPPKKGRSHGLRLIRELLYHPPRHRGTDLNAPLDALQHLQRRKTVSFLLSDFLASGYEQALRIAARRHDLIAVRFTDPRERELADIGLVQVEDPESGEVVLIDTGDKEARRAYQQRAESREEHLRQGLRRAGCDFIDVDISQSVVDPLQRFFLRRERRR